MADKEITWDDVNSLHMLYADRIARGDIGWERVPALFEPQVRFVYNEITSGK